MEQQQRNKVVGALATVIFHGALLYMLLFWGFQKPFPPPGEEGILISFGSTQTGRGVAQPTVAQPLRRTPPPAAQREQQQYLTQDYEQTAAIRQPRRRRAPKNDKRRNVKTTEQPEQTRQPQKPEEKPREVKRNALFPGKGTANSQGQGTGSEAGNQGAQNGSANGSPRGTGLGLSGSGATLEGRSLVGKLPEPDYGVQQSGRVIVRIRVDRDGYVVEAKADQRGSTVMDATLYEAAERAARRAKFNTSPNSPIHQIGTITYVFRLGQ
ncbi:MAG: TonB family protein [Prevotellaceae bacterium]|nr:TonB family protein [Prevotellaceae bacterium]